MLLLIWRHSDLRNYRTGMSKPDSIGSGTSFSPSSEPSSFDHSSVLPESLLSQGTVGLSANAKANGVSNRYPHDSVVSSLFSTNDLPDIKMNAIASIHPAMTLRRTVTLNAPCSSNGPIWNHSIKHQNYAMHPNSKTRPRPDLGLVPMMTPQLKHMDVR